MKRRLVFWFALLAVFLTSGCGLVALSASSAQVKNSEVGFASRQGLRDHYLKHGGEFKASSEGEYLALAQTLRDSKPGGSVLENVRADGVMTRFDKRTGAFLACNPNGTIRTFFKPNDGERYYWRQLKR